MFVSVGKDVKFHSVGKNYEFESFKLKLSSSEKKIAGISFCCDDTIAAVVLEGENPKILHVKDKLKIRLINIISVENVTALTFGWNTKEYLALGTKDGNVVLCNTRDGVLTDMSSPIGSSIKALEYSSDDQQLVGISADMFFYFTEKGDLLKFRQNCDCTCLKCHHIIPDRVALGLTNGCVIIWDLRRNHSLIQLEVFTFPVSAVAMSYCGKFLISAADKVTICGLDFEKECCDFQYHVSQENPVTSMDVRYDDEYMVIGLSDGTIKVCQVEPFMKTLSSKRLHCGPVSKILFEHEPKDLITMPPIDNRSKLVSPISTTSSVAKIKLAKKECRNQRIKKMGDHLMQKVKHEMNSLDSKLEKYCDTFQKYLDDEFKTFENIQMSKWGMFEVMDTEKVLEALFEEYERSKEGEK